MTRKRKKQQKKRHRIQPITAPGCDWAERNIRLEKEIRKALHQKKEDPETVKRKTRFYIS